MTGTAPDVLIPALYRGGIPRRSPHSVRHAFAAGVLEKTKNVMAVKDLLGHESLTCLRQPGRGTGCWFGDCLERSSLTVDTRKKDNVSPGFYA